MRAVILLGCFFYSRAAVATGGCDGKHVNGTYHEKEVLKRGLDRPYQLVVDKKTNTLFFSYSVGATEDDNFKSAYIDLNNNTFGEISNIKDGFANAVDQDRGTIYLGGSDGIYTFHNETKSAVFAKARGKNIWVLFFKDKLYFVDYPLQQLYVYDSGEPEPVKTFENSKITQFVIDNNDEIFFANDTGLYGLRKNDAIENAFLYDKIVAIRGIALDINGKAFFCGENGIFTMNDGKIFTNIVGIYDAFGLAFDKDNNIIYATADEIVRLKPSKKKC